MKKQNLFKLTFSAVFAALSIVILLIVPQFPIFPTAPWLLYDAADIPLILACLILPIYYSEAILAVVCFIQAFFMGGSGIIGFLMHFIATSVLILTFFAVNKLLKSNKKYILGIVLASVLMALVMIPVSYIFYPLYGLPVKAVSDLLFPCILPFNLLKAFLNSTIAVIVFYILKPIVKTMEIQ